MPSLAFPIELGHSFFRRLALYAFPIAMLLPASADGQDPKPSGKASAGKVETVDFVKDVQPILRTTCHSCHGPEEQEGGLRLDIRERALEGGDSGKTIEPKNAAKSTLLARVSGSDPDLDRMPPEGEGTPLSKAQVTVLRTWIEQGAIWPADADAVVATDHWAFKPIEKPELPKVKNSAWVRNPIDAFVLAKLENEGVHPSPAASREMLIRRLYIDLLGLPPSPETAEAFLSRKKSSDYEALVEQILKSKHYGERWGRHWLDLARYADSDGYEKDRARPHAWRYREWVINALNNDMPFDEFTIRQIAGDMLPDATIENRVATGFHRNTLHNTEGGTDKEEDRVKKTVDRTNTVSSIWLGLTLGCAQCHSHKYDPITQREYYSMYGFFNSIDEQDISAPLPEENERYRKAKATYDSDQAKLKNTIASYRKSNIVDAAAKWAETSEFKGVVWTTWKPASAVSKHGAEIKPQKDGSYLASGKNLVSDIYTLHGDSPVRSIGAIRLEVLPDKSLVKNGPGRADNGNFVLTTLSAVISRKGGKPQRIEFASAESSFAQQEWDAKLAINDNKKDGWAVGPQFGKRHVAMFVANAPFEVVADDSLEIVLNQTYDRVAPHNIGRFRLSLTDSSTPVLEGNDAKLVAALAAAAAKRTPEQKRLIEDHYGKTDKGLLELEKKLAEHAKKAPAVPTTKAQATNERKQPRETRVHIRGDFLNPGDTVAIKTLSALPPLKPRSKTPDRLDYGRWLVGEDQPLTARVTVNRVWQRYFGAGIVATSDDFGTQGDLPSHPQLLNWLAADFVEHGWSLKQLHRTIVNSATYRQSSAHRPELIDRDPDNQWLARQTRRRVEGEIVRDLALSVSGLLNPKIGGPSVRPKQPSEYSGLTYANSARWTPSKGGDQYRRGLYTFFQRTSPYPMLMTFDSPDANACTARRSVSNTPLQALTLWNDPVFFECSQMLGRRIYTQADGDDEAAARTRIARAFLICLSRRPSDLEMQTMLETYQLQRKISAADEKRAAQIAGSQGLPKNANAVETSAWVIVGRILLNIDEFVAKE